MYRAWSSKANDTPSRALASPKQHINTITHTPTWKRPSPCRRKISQRNLSNGKILDPNFALASLKRNTATKKPKLITAEDDVPQSTLRISGSTPAPREIGFLRRGRLGKETTHPKKQATGTMQPRRISSVIRLCILQSPSQLTSRPVT
jgi:hypothetical protein